MCFVFQFLDRSPFYLLRTRLQSRAPSAISTGYQHKITGVVQGFGLVLKQDGFRGLFTGVQSQMLRVCVGSGAQLATYDSAKRVYLRWTGGVENVAAHIVCGAVSAAAVTAAMAPFDMIASRLANQRLVSGKGAFYSGIADCFIKTVRFEGIRALYKGNPSSLPIAICFCFWNHSGVVSDYGSSLVARKLLPSFFVIELTSFSTHRCRTVILAHRPAYPLDVLIFGANKESIIRLV